MKNVLLMVLIILIVVNVTFTVQVTKDISKIKEKVYPPIAKCNKCNSTEITLRTDNPKSLPRLETMDDIASRPAISFTTENAVMSYFNHTLTCNKCGYQVKYQRTY